MKTTVGILINYQFLRTEKGGAKKREYSLGLICDLQKVTHFHVFNLDYYKLGMSTTYSFVFSR